MATAVWKGQLTFGLVSVPIRLYRAARKERVRFHYVAPAAQEVEPPEPATRATRDLPPSPAVVPLEGANEAEPPPPAVETPVSRITQSFQRPDGEGAISRRELLRGHEVAPDQYVTFTQQELRMLRPETSTEMQIVRSVSLPEIDPVYFESSYYVAPDRAGERGEVELRPHRKFADSRLGALVAAVHAEMVAGFPNGRLFLGSVEQAMAVTLVSGHAVRQRPVQFSRGGLGPARLRRIRELVHAKMEDELSLGELAQSVGLTTAHFARMFRKTTGETPHQFVLRQRLERAKAMLRVADARILDVAVACGFKTQQHFAQVFRGVCGISPTECRRDFLGYATCVSETCSEDTSRLVIVGSQP